jgi:hypothetical protein
VAGLVKMTLLLMALLVLVVPAMGQVPDPRVTQDNIRTTICRQDWVRAAQPPAEIARAKEELIQDAGVGDSNTWNMDHIIPVCLGGAPFAQENLRLQSWQGSCNAKDKARLDAVICKAVCRGDVTLGEAQVEITTDWKAAYKHWVDKRGCE